MAGEVRIGGSTASVKLQGNDSITSDQTFTFPDAGGELATVPAGGQVPGYAEGTYTPSIVDADGAPIGGIVYDSQNVYWTRIGRLVSVQAIIAWNSRTNASADSVKLSLPFKTSDVPFYRSGAAWGYCNGINGSGQMVGGVNPNSAIFTVYRMVDVNQTQAVQINELRAAGGQFQFSVQYITDEAFS